VDRWKDEQERPPDDVNRPTARLEREPWEPPTITAVGTIADLIRAPKKSGTQDCGGRRRFLTGIGCGS
jgi:hypothetical protein